ncbi:MAG TPA: restriction endonuclease [Candidatus Dormibacteraeota bacterium]|nr:restriction endonuclease [Candidatus Dormibacteraeota bacterium]
MSRSYRCRDLNLIFWIIVIVITTLARVVHILIRVIRKLIFRRQNYAFNKTSMDTMDGLTFERYIAQLLKKHGYINIKLTERYDYGVDIIAYKNSITWGIQVKCYSGLVKADAVRQVVTGLKKYKCDRAMVITNSYFSNVAKELARCNDCALADRDMLFNRIC